MTGASRSRYPLPSRRHLFLARHGETDWNLAGRWQGHTDVPLNATGRAQAALLAERMRVEGITTVASSDLSRARRTAEIVAEALGVPVALVDPDLREQRFGRFEGLTPAECEVRHPDDWARYVGDRHAGPPGGESHAALIERVVRGIEAAARLPGPALVVSHGGALRALLAALPAGTGAPANGWPARIPNGGLVRVSIVAGRAVAATWVEP